MIQQGLTTSFKQNLLAGTQGLESRPLKIALYTGLADIGPDTLAYKTENEVVGTGYTAGGKLLTGLTILADLNSGTVYANFDNVAWPEADFTARGALIYDDSDLLKKSVAVLDFGADRLFTPTNNTVTMPVNSATTALIRFP